MKKRSSLFWRSTSDEEKSFIKLITELHGHDGQGEGPEKQNP